MTHFTEIEIALAPEEAVDEAVIREKALRETGIADTPAAHVVVHRRSIDARGRRIWFRLRVRVYEGPPPAVTPVLDKAQDVSKAPPVVIVGAGPAGYFAALECLELGVKPIVLDRGKDVQARRRDLKAIQQAGEVNPHSNYCFGEGGAGTYSDGKLYTRSHKRGSIEKVLRLFVEHGATEDILIDAHPHIGSNKLPPIVANMRATIVEHGGEVHFDTHVTGLMRDGASVTGVVSADGREWPAGAVIMATGHSARDVFRMLHKEGIPLEVKPYALGVRVEHPQSIIDRSQYGMADRGPYLPASSYRLTCQVAHKGVFSFCMCPGGLIVPAATAPGEIVVNGMSLSRRDSPYANSGVVTAVDVEDFAPFVGEGVLAGMAYQQSVERAVWAYGDGSQKAPAQRLTDFVSGKISSDLNASSYIPGLYPAPVHELLPGPVYQRLREGLVAFGGMLHGYMTAEANVVATESRSSSPVKVPRDDLTLMQPAHPGLFPCGEGAGYAGGILSAAMDGQRVAKAVAQYLGRGE